MTSAVTSSAPEWVSLAVFLQPHGVQGHIKVKSFTDPADDFLNHSPLTDEKGKPLKLTLKGHAAGYAVVAVEGVTGRNEAELLRGRKIGTPRAALPPLSTPNRYYVDDLIGMAVVLADGTPFGVVAAMANYGAGDILTVRHETGAESLYAFTHRTFPEVDSTHRRMVIDPPEILEAAPPTKKA